MKRLSLAALLVSVLAFGATFANLPALLAQGQGRGGGGFGQLPPGGRGGNPARDGVASETTGTAVIRGRILAADTGAPLRRAQVRATAAETREARLASSDAQGRFELKDLPAGRWTLTASKAGFMTLRYGQRRPFEAGQTIDVADGQVMERVDVALPRGAAITGRVFDEFGDPVAGARVQVLRYQMVQGTRRLTPAGGGDQTDDTGAFRIYGLAPGDYYLNATLRAALGPIDDPADTGYAATFYPGTGNVAEAQRVSLSVGEELPNISFPLLPVRTVRVMGTAVDSTGKPLTNGAVSLMNAQGADGLFVFNIGGGGGRIRNDGSFTLTNVAPGSYVLMAVSGFGGFRRGGGGAGEMEFAAVPLTIGNEDLAGVSVVTSRGATVAGTLVAAQGSASTLSPEGVQVVTQSAQPFPGPPMPPARVDGDGHFELTNLMGERFIRVNGLPQEWMLKAVMIDSTDVTDTPVAFKSGEEIEGLQIVVSDRVTEVTGRVLTSGGQPTRDYTVVVFPEDPSKWKFPSRYLKSGRADQQGQFKVRALPPDSRYLAIALDYLEEGQGSDPEFLREISDLATKFSLGDGEAKALDLKLVQR